MGNAMPIKWHEECLSNMQRNLAAKERALARAQAEYDRCLTDVIRLGVQIARAKREGKGAFDAEKYSLIKTRVSKKRTAKT